MSLQWNSTVYGLHSFIRLPHTLIEAVFLIAQSLGKKPHNFHTWIVNRKKMTEKKNLSSFFAPSDDNNFGVCNPAGL